MYLYTFGYHEKCRYIFAGRTLYTWQALVTGVYTDDKHGCKQQQQQQKQ